MPQSLSCVYSHLIFSTKLREPLIEESIQNSLFDYIGGICKHYHSYPLQVGGYKDHVHILCVLPKDITQIKFVEEIKKGSSKWMKAQGQKYSIFYWQRGYGLFSVNPTEAERVVKYIKNQKEHHKNRGFKDELRAFLRKYNIDFDERYVWD